MRILDPQTSFLAQFNAEARARGVRVIGDVHGDVQAFRHAISTQRFIIQLGDLIDYGPDSDAVLYLMLSLIEAKKGLFVLGNHDRKLARVLDGRRARINAELESTLRQIDASRHGLTRNIVSTMLNSAPAWIVINQSVFVHGGFHPTMLHTAPSGGTGKISPILSRALYGETTKNQQPDGYPERVLNWVNQIPRGYTVYCGHDNRSHNGRPFVKTGAAGGQAFFLDLGAGKGGHLAWIDLDATKLFNATYNTF